VRLVSIHETGRWPHTGAADDTAGGHALNLPVPRGFDDAGLARLMDDVVLPHLAAFRPEAVVLTCGADALAGDPLAHLALTNVALWDAVDALVAAAPIAVVLGGGGYNPWTLARYWTGLWARLSGREVPHELPEAARAVLARLSCDLVDDADIRPEWLSTLADRQEVPA
jgi:acetoin utilization protein AcuC